MSTTVSISRRSPSRRTQILASASALVAAAAVAVTLAVAGGGDGQPSGSQPAARSATAQPNPATQYRNDSALERRSAQGGGGSPAERFHHFR